MAQEGQKNAHEKKKQVQFEPAFFNHVSMNLLSSVLMRLLFLQNACLPVYWQKSCHSLSIPSSFPDESPQTHYEDEKYGVHYANHRKQSHEVVLGSADNNHRSDPPSFTGLWFSARWTYHICLIPGTSSFPCQKRCYFCELCRMAGIAV